MTKFKPVIGEMKILTTLLLMLSFLSVFAQHTGNVLPLKNNSIAANNPTLVSYASYIPYDSTQVLRNDPSLLYVNFERNESVLKHDFRNNAATLDKMEEMIGRMLNDSLYRVRTILIIGMASIEGSFEYNKRLAMDRATSVKRYLQQRFNLPDSAFELVSAGEAWTELRSLVEENQFEGRKQVLDIIDNVSNPWLREKRIRELNNGKVYQYLLDQHFADQRSAGYIRIYFDEIQPAITSPIAVAEEPEPQPMREVVADALVEEQPLMVESQSVPVMDVDRKWLVAVKTNMLFDAALAPNIEVERLFGKNNRFSVMAEVWFPWYVWRHNSNAYEVLNIGLEGRYWFTHSKKYPNRPLTGLFAGVYAAGGKYDIEWKSEGNQGEYTSLGATIGYTWRIGRNLNLEASASAGWVSGPYRHYEGRFDDTHLIWQRNGQLSYFGPTKLKFSLVWLWPDRRRR